MKKELVKLRNIKLIIKLLFDIVKLKYKEMTLKGVWRGKIK